MGKIKISRVLKVSSISRILKASPTAPTQAAVQQEERGGAGDQAKVHEHPHHLHPHGRHPHRRPHRRLRQRLLQPRRGRQVSVAGG